MQLRVKLLSLSQGHCQPLGDDDEHVSATQLDDEAAQENMDAVASHEPHTDSAEHIQKGDDRNPSLDNRVSEENTSHASTLPPSDGIELFSDMWFIVNEECLMSSLMASAKEGN